MPRGSQVVTIDRQKLTDLRAVRELSQAELARLSHCSYGMIGMIEAGVRTPSVELAGRIAAALGCEITDFATVSDR